MRMVGCAKQLNDEYLEQWWVDSTYCKSLEGIEQADHRKDWQHLAEMFEQGQMLHACLCLGPCPAVICPDIQNLCAESALLCPLAYKQVTTSAFCSPDISLPCLAVIRSTSLHALMRLNQGLHWTVYQTRRAFRSNDHWLSVVSNGKDVKLCIPNLTHLPRFSTFCTAIGSRSPVKVVRAIYIFHSAILPDVFLKDSWHEGASPSWNVSNKAVVGTISSLLAVKT